MTISKNKVYTLIFGLFIVAFMLNSVSFGSLKLFYLFIPAIFLYYIGIKKIIVYPENYLFFTFLLISTFSFLFPLMNNNLLLLKGSISVFIDLFIIFLLILVFSNIIDMKYFEIFSNWSIVGSFILLAHFLLYYSGGRYEGFFNDPNYFNSLLLLFLFIIIYNLEKTKEMFFLKRAISFIAIISLVLISITTASRSGILSIIVFFLFYVIYFIKRYNFKRLLKVIFLLVLVFILIYSLNFINIQDKINYILSRFFSQPGSSDYGSGYMRIIEIRNGINLIRKKPLVFCFGSGLGTTSITEWYSNFSVDNSFRTSRIHNTFMSVLVEHGIFSFFVYIILILYFIYLIIKSNDFSKYIILGLFMGQMLLSSFVWTITFTPFWISLFLGAKLSRIEYNT